MSNRKIIRLSVLNLFFSWIVAASCSKSNPAPTVSFNKQILPIIIANCTINSSCHMGANGGNQLTDFDSSAAYPTIINRELISTKNPTSSLLYVEVVSGAMPKLPYLPLSASQAELILNWIKQGAKDN